MNTKNTKLNHFSFISKEANFRVLQYRGVCKHDPSMCEQNRESTEW
jgi:hypothetical protein